MTKNSLQEINKRTEWFQKDRFGMFIHWGLYSIPGKGSGSAVINNYPLMTISHILKHLIL